MPGLNFPQDAGRFVKRPIRVEAVRVTRENADDVGSWCGGSAYERFLFGKLETMVVAIPNGRALKEAVEGDWVVHFVDDGVFVRMRDDEFRSTFQPAPEEGTTDDKLRPGQTVKEALDRCIEIVEERARITRHPTQLRNLSLAVEHMEDAQARYDRACAPQEADDA